MVPSSSQSYCSFADMDPYKFGPPSVPLHPPPPQLPGDVLVCGGRQRSASFLAFEAPAFAEDLLAIHLRVPIRLSVKLEHLVYVDSAPGDFILVPRGTASAWGNEGAPEALMVVQQPPPALPTQRRRCVDFHFVGKFPDFLQSTRKQIPTRFE